MTRFNRPVPFSGTPEEINRNFNSHWWGYYDGEERCRECDCKVWHAAAKYPCGATIPREDVDIDWSRFDALIEAAVKHND